MDVSDLFYVSHQYSLALLNLEKASKAMTTFYVSTTGSDSNSGASGSPVKSITKAAQLAQAGDTVLVGAGTYNGTVSISKNGTASAPITVKPADGAKVVIDGAGPPAGTDLVVISGDYVTFQGFEVANAKRAGIGLWEHARHQGDRQQRP